TTPAASAFAVLVNGSSRTINSVSVASGTTVQLNFTTANRIYGGDTVTVQYTQPVSNKLQDNAANLVASDGSAQAVTNTAPASVTTSTIGASPSSIIADGSTTSTITVQLKTAAPASANLSASGGAVTVSTSAGTFPGSCTTDCAT